MQRRVEGGWGRVQEIFLGVISIGSVEILKKILDQYDASL